jgi:hypothetical protein
MLTKPLNKSIDKLDQLTVAGNLVSSEWELR